MNSYSESNTPILNKIILVSLFTCTAFSMFSISITQIAAGVGGMAWLIRTHINRVWQEQQWPLRVPLACYMIACLIAVIFAVDPSYSFKELRKLLEILIFFWVVNCVREKRLRDALSTLLIIAATLACFYSIYQGWKNGIDLDHRFEGTMSVYMTFAGLLMLVGVFSLGRVLFRQPREIWPWPIIGIFLVCLLLTYTRQAWFGVFMGFLFLIFVWRKKQTVIISGVIIALILVYGSQIRLQLMDLTSKWDDVTVNGRGFFQVALPDGTIAYSRAESFKMNNTGQVVTADGLPLDPAITIPADAVQISIDENGSVSVVQSDPTRPTVLGKLKLVTFQNRAGLISIGNNVFKETDTSGAPTIVTLNTGKIIKSNRWTVEQFTGVMSYRIYKMLNPENDETFNMRLALWEGGWLIFKDHPLTGCGFKCVDLIHTKYPDPTGHIKNLRGMHNNIIQLAVDTGVIGLIAWSGIWFSFFRLSYLRNKFLDGNSENRWIIYGSAATGVAFLAGGLFETNFYDSEVVMLLYFIMALPFAHLKHNKVNKPG